jgi:hypothetical protein
VVSGRYVRKDGTRARRYVCNTHRERPWACPEGPFDALLVDKGFVARLDAMIGDVTSWREALSAGRADERERLNREAERAQNEVQECERVAALMERGGTLP